MQVILVEVYGMNPTVEEVKLGKLTKKSRTFEEYVGKAVRKLQLDPDKVSEEEEEEDRLKQRRSSRSRRS